MQANSPYKLLLNQQHRNAPLKRNAEEIQILNELIINNSIFQFLNIDKQLIQEISNQILLIWTDQPQIISIAENQIYLVLDGAAFQYMHNKSVSLKVKLHENNDYIMIRKISANDFFAEYSLPKKYQPQMEMKKYQYMVDQETLLGRISGDLFRKIFASAFSERWKKIHAFCKNISMLNSLPVYMLYQLNAYFIEIQYSKDSQIISKSSKSPYVYFIEKGEVEFKVSQKNSQPKYRQSFSKNYKEKFIQQERLHAYDSFGMETYSAPEIEQFDAEYQATALTNCSLYRIDKRILAIVISSFQKGHSRSVSSINLNEQISGQCHEATDISALTKNARTIKSSEKKIRDIKLRFLSTSRRTRSPHKQFEEHSEEQHLDLRAIKSQSCHNLQKVRENLASSLTYSQINPQIQNSSQSQKRFSLKNRKKLIAQQEQPKISHIFLSPSQDDFYFTEMSHEPQKQVHELTTFFLTSQKFSKIKKKSQSFQSFRSSKNNPAKNYLDNKLKVQMLRKAQMILERNNMMKNKEKPKLKLNLGDNRLRNNLQKRTLSQQEPRKKSVSSQFNYRISKIIDNPLLDIVQSQRKNKQREKNQKKVLNCQQTHTKQGMNRKQQGLILISNL